MRFHENVELAPHTTFRIGGPARWFAEACSESDLLEGIAFAMARTLPLFVLGGGSNLLIADAGFDGLVLKIGLLGIEDTPVAPGRLFSAAAGENWDQFVSLAVRQNCGGVECLAGIPGTVGGTPVQNVGAYGQEVSSTIVQVRALDLATMLFVELSAADCRFAYRRSLFNTTARDRYIVSRVDYLLNPSSSPQLEYADLKHHFKNSAQTPTLLQVTEAVREIRNRKGMLLTPGEPDSKSAGSFFKNPIVSEAAISQVAQALALETGTIPRYRQPDGRIKLPAAWLLEQAGFHKGYALGPAAISSRHTLALTNRGNARAADILILRDLIVARVHQRFGVMLEQEPVMVGR